MLVPAAHVSENIATTKLFVVDTNVILHDATSLRNFKEHDVAIPMAVLEELDRFKKGNEDIHYQARAFLRSVDSLTGDVMSANGASLGERLGSVRIVLNGDPISELENAFMDDCPDHRILNVALRLREEQPNRSVILVTKDTNLRMKAKAFGLVAQDYSTDKVTNFEKLYTGKRLIDHIPSDQIGLFSDNGGHVAKELVPEVVEPIANENFILRNGSRSVLATYDAEQKKLRRLDKISASGICPRNAEQAFALRALLDDSLKLVTLAGKAGSGKTLLALAAAMECRVRYQQTLIARPIVPLSNRDLGFLPGDLQAKLDPYMQPLYDNLSVILQNRNRNTAALRGQELLEEYQIEVAPLAYIRGRSLHRAFFIIDEAQNLTPHEIKTIITRAGEGTKIVFTGDIHQIDHPYLDSLSNGLSYVIDRLTGQSLYAHISLEKGERSELSELASRLL